MSPSKTDFIGYSMHHIEIQGYVMHVQELLFLSVQVTNNVT